MSVNRGRSRVVMPRGAFTLTELLVVISIIVLILAMALPAFSSMLYSMTLSTSQNALQVAITAARDAAVRASYGQDAAAVVTFAPNGRITIIPCVQAGTLKGWAGAQNKSDRVDHDVFVPAVGVEPVQLPRSWAVSGFAPLHTIDGPAAPNDSGWYDSGNYPADQTNWVFPESDFFEDSNNVPHGLSRQTFMVRFEGGTGAYAAASTDPALIVLPATAHNPFGTDMLRSVQRILFTEDVDGDGQVNNADTAARVALLGDISPDTVLARPVSQVALYNLRKLAGAAGATGLNRDTECLFIADASGNPVFDPQIFAGNPVPATITKRVNDWIAGELVLNNKLIESDAIIFSFQKYLGEAQELIQPEAQ